MLENPNIRAPIAIGLGAIAGALSRYYLGQWLTQSLSMGFPIGTFLVNVSGCFLIGLITTLAPDRLYLNPDLTLSIITGFLGAYTTFSAYELDTESLLAQKHLQTEFVYWLGSPLLGLLCFSLGVSLAKIAQPPS